MKKVIENINTYLDKPARALALLLTLSIGVLIACLSYYNEASEGGPDGHWHYYFSKYSYQYPKFFLHHWGKPIFIFLSAPFSQLGFYALNIFNIICGLLSAYITYKWCKKLNFGFSYIAIILVLFTPLYFLVIQSALTEPLFSLLLVLTAFLLFSEKYVLGAVIASFLMYSRTEGTFLIVIFMSYSVIMRQWKSLPFYATAFIIYSFVGLFSGHDFFWFFTENPYHAESPYGKGTWTHFFDQYQIIFGRPFVKLLSVGTLLMILGIINNREYLFFKKAGNNFKIFYLAFIPSVVYFMFHVYAWATGKFASAGLERVIAAIVPLCVIVCMYVIDLIYSVKFPLIRYFLLVFILVSFIKATFKEFSYPIKAHNGEKAELEASKWFKNYRKENSTIYYAHPAIVFYSNYDPFDARNKECFNFPGPCGPTDGSVGKFYYFWDSQFTQFGCGKTLEDIEKCPTMVKIKEFSDMNFKVVVFESK